MFFDIETTGLPEKAKNTKTKYFPPEEILHYDSSRMVSIAWIVYNQNKQKLFSKQRYILPDGFISHPRALEVHGITDEYAKENGLPIQTVMDEFYKDLQGCSMLAGYNVNFDYFITLSECYRYHFKDLINLLISKKVKIECVQRKCINKIINIQAKRKFYPRLEEVYRQLFNDQNFNTSHDALDDTLRCAEVYFKLI